MTKTDGCGVLKALILDVLNNHRLENCALRKIEVLGWE